MVDSIAFVTPDDWNAWLAANPDAREVWVLFHRKGSAVSSITWESAVIEALAYGWIDGVKKSISPTTWAQRFTPRRAGSAWSQKNIQHAEMLIETGRMAPAGMTQVDIARKNGRWQTAYSGGKDAVIPQDFLNAVAQIPAAQAGFNRLDSKNRYAIYYRLTTAKLPATRAKRIDNFIKTLSQGKSIL